MNQSTLIIAFRPSHAARVVRAWQETSGEKPDILVLDVELEWLLTKAGIPFVSQTQLHRNESVERFTHIEAWVAAMIRSTALNSYTYRDIPFLKAYAYALQFYFVQVAFYAPLLARVLSASPVIRTVLVCAEEIHERPEQIVLTRDPSGAVLRATKWAAKECGVAVHLLKEQKGRSRVLRLARTRHLLTRSLFGLGIGILNACMAVLPQKKMRILASENWANIAPLLSESFESELVLLDRAEVRRMGILSALRHRVRFLHIVQYLNKAAQQRAKHGAHAIMKRWTHAADTLPGLELDGISMHPFMQEALDTLFVCGVPRITREIEGAFRMLEHHKPHVVLLRASVSNQTHFPILSLVARSLAIPAVELQHGLEYLGPGSISRAHTAEYIASYGPLVAKELQAVGYPSDKTLVAGSPRFDAYKVIARSKSVSAQTRTVLVLAPEMVATFFDTYEVNEYYRAAAAAVGAMPGAAAIIKIRPMPEREAFHRKAIAGAFKDIPHTIAQYESVAECLSQADMLVTCYSTVVLEAFLSDVPVVLAAISVGDRLSIDGHFMPYADAGALRIAHSEEELVQHVKDLTNPIVYSECILAAQAFLGKHYKFDGASSERTLAQIRKLAALSSSAH